MSSSNATNDDPSMLWFEQAIHASTHIGAMAFGIHLTIYTLATYYGLHQPKIAWKWVVFNTTLFVFGTVNLAASIHFNETAWIDDRNYPGGPYYFLVEQQNRPVVTVANAASVVTSTLAEGLLLYRVYVIWNQWYITVLPVLFFVACIILSIFVVIQIALPFSPTWTSLPSFAFPVWMMLMVLNLVLTLLLAIRLLYMRRQLQSSMGASSGRAYIGVIAMVIESALPFGIISIIFLVLFGKQDPAQNLFIPLLVQVECISPMLIILRVIRGQALGENTIPDRSVSTAQFAPATRSVVSESSRIHDIDITLERGPKLETSKESSGSTVNIV